MLIKAKGEEVKLLEYLAEKGYSYDYEQALIRCGSGQEKQFLAHLLEGGYDYAFQYSDECRAEIEPPGESGAEE